MDTHISRSRGRTRLLFLAAAVAVLAVVAWALSASGGGGQVGAGAADTTPTTTSAPPTDATSAPADAPTEPTDAATEPADTASAPTDSATAPADPPTEMPDGTPIPAPSPGTPATTGKGATEPVEPVSVLAPVDLEDAADFGTGLAVELAGITPVRGVARVPGEIAGPALEVSVEASNDSAEAISLEGVIVFLSYGEDRTPSSVFNEGSSPLAGDLSAGGSVTGTYVFAVPEDQRDDVRVEISYTGEAPTVAFAGSVA